LIISEGEGIPTCCQKVQAPTFNCLFVESKRRSIEEWSGLSC